MSFSLKNGKIAVRFAGSFILHQISLFLLVSMPSVLYFVWQKRQSLDVDYSNEVVISTVLLYIAYCVFYGYYVAYPMIYIILVIKKLAGGDYQVAKLDKKLRLSYRLYQEVYHNLDYLADKLQEEEIKRSKFDRQRKDWAAGVTHDLKTPLSYISGYVEMLLSAKHDWSESEKEDFLIIIKEKSQYMKTLIDDLGLVFRLDNDFSIQIRKEKIEIVETLRRVLAEIAGHPKAEKYLFEIRADQAKLYLEGDKELLTRAFSNVIMNAVLHNPVGTKIFLSVEGKNKELLIQMLDNGIGMTKTDTLHLFERYYRGTDTDTHTAGTGLGMAIVRQIIEIHGGRISVESELNAGTRIMMYLPYH